MSHRVISTDKAPKAIGPYSQGIATPGIIFCSGQVGLDPVTGILVDGDIKDQARQALSNLSAVLQAAGSSLERVVKTTIFLAHIEDFAAVNAVYGEVFTKNLPARSTIGGVCLPRGALVEIELIAEVGD
jgi:2-iminobutanoate/2-iminopropanoate deaminase